LDVIYRVVGTEERIPIPLMDYILNVVCADLDTLYIILFNVLSHYYSSDYILIT